MRYTNHPAARPAALRPSIRTPRWSRSLAPFALLALLGACATATVVEEDAGAVVASTRLVVAEARTFYTRLSEKRVHYVLRTLAASKHCNYGWPAVLLRDASQLSGWRCLDPDESRLRLTCLDEPGDERCSSPEAALVLKAMRFELAPTRHLAALALMQSMADYTTVLATIVADPKVDSSAELTRLAERVDTLRDLFDALQGRQATTLDLRKELAAAGALLDLVRHGAEEQRDLEALRGVLRAKGPAFEESLATLAHEYRSLHLEVAAVLDAELLSDEVERLRGRFPKLSEEARVKAMQSLAAAEIAAAARAAAPDPLAQAFEKLHQAHVELRLAALDATFTDAQRQRKAAAARQRLMAWFTAIRDLLVLI